MIAAVGFDAHPSPVERLVDAEGFESLA